VDAYTHLLVDLCDFEKEVTMDDLEEITKDILEHSDVNSFCGQYGCSEEELFDSTLWKVINECCKHYGGMAEQTPSQKAKEEFKRPVYQVARLIRKQGECLHETPEE